MPNSRRRRFSVKPYLAANERTKNDALSSTNALENKLKPRGQPQQSARNKNKNPLLESESESQQTVDENKTNTPNTQVTAEKEVNASSSNIDFYNLYTIATDNPQDNTELVKIAVVPAEVDEPELKQTEKKDMKLKSDKYPRQHRVKVRSPRRRMKCEHEDISNVGVDAIDWETESEANAAANVQQCVIIDNVDNLIITDPESTRSLEQMCRICHGNEDLSADLGPLTSTCSCRGTVGRVHVKCLERWLTESGKSRCELCGTRYSTRRVHKYGFVKALAMWVLNQNAKQLMVDTIGIVLMSPLAVIAAWLSGRTLAGLMTPDSHPTPWPLASTFVLACMTLVCYYCWIVSAVSRHALGWWIWYRSQYEVRLQIPGPGE